MVPNNPKILLLAKQYYKNINNINGYINRTRFSEKYYDKWYRNIAKLDLGKEPTPINQNVINFFPNNIREKSIYLVSPSIEEIKIFSRNFKKVYFSSIPKIYGDFPGNVIQINFDKYYRLPKKYFKNGVDFAFSHHVIEHIHPKDIMRHFKEIYSLLKNNGSYLIVCPSSIRILKDQNSKIQMTKISAFHHIGRYSYNYIRQLCSKVGYKKCYKPIINPNIYKYFNEYKNDWCYDYIEKYNKFIPDIFLSIFGFNSLYILVTK